MEIFEDVFKWIKGEYCRISDLNSKTVCFSTFKRFMQFYVFTGRSSALVQKHNKNNMINGKIT